TVSFQDLFYNLLGTNGSGDQLQVGSGAAVGSINTSFNNGTVQSTGVNTDAAITGNGFFIVQNGSNTYYTRSGDFTQNSNGYLVDSNGDQVMGYPAVNGVVNTSGGLAPIQLPMGMTSPPTATANLSIDANLNSGAAVGDTYNTSVTVYDSLGTAQVLSLDFTNTGSGWTYNATLPSSAITGATGTTTTVASGTLNFDSNGNLTSTAPVAINVSGLADGASPMAINWNLAGSNGQGLITQVAGTSSTSSTSQDGNTSGTLSSFTINADGTITGAFTNGSETLGQIALANFANLEGLSQQGGNNYSATLSSGSAVVGTPGSSSLGTLTGSALENSNVDMSTEFTNLIIAERGFQANAKSVTTFDQIAQDTINLIR
ncbi:MAG: flagellar hook protein FlgE, partial [Candidatus Korobacteraceae bacterium]